MHAKEQCEESGRKVARTPLLLLCTRRITGDAKMRRHFFAFLCSEAGGGGESVYARGGSS